MSAFARGFLSAYALAGLYAGTLFYKAHPTLSIIGAVQAAIVWPVSAAGIFSLPRAAPPVGSDEPCGDDDVCAG